jgi:hypothetical protein
MFKLKMNFELEVWLKWQNTCIASMKPPVQTPVLPQNEKSLKNHDRHIYIYIGFYVHTASLRCN